MFDFTPLMESWAGKAAKVAGVAEADNFSAKLSRIGIKAPLGTPPAEEQLAKAIAKVQVANGGAGNFMGEPLNDQGVNANMLKAELVVGDNMPYGKADYLVDHNFAG